MKEKWADVEMKNRRHVKNLNSIPYNRILKRKVQNVPNFGLEENLVEQILKKQLFLVC